MPTPRKAKVHKAFEGLVDVLAGSDRRVDRHARGDNDFSLDTFLIFVRELYAIQSDSRGPCWDRIAAGERPAHDLRFYGSLDFLDEFRMDVEIFEGSWHRLRLSKLPGIFQFVIAVT